jgi:hypothetical protein
MRHGKKMMLGEDITTKVGTGDSPNPIDDEDDDDNEHDDDDGGGGVCVSYKHM